LTPRIVPPEPVLLQKPTEGGIVVALDSSLKPEHGSGPLGRPLKAKDFDFAVDGVE